MWLNIFQFHGSCVKITESMSKKLREYVCEECKQAKDDKDQISIEWITYGAANNDDSKNARKNRSAGETKAMMLLHFLSCTTFISSNQITRLHVRNEGFQRSFLVFSLKETPKP